MIKDTPKKTLDQLQLEVQVAYKAFLEAESKWNERRINDYHDKIRGQL